MKTKIYALRENGFVRYVGKTTRELSNRLCGHLRNARDMSLHTHKCNWIRSLLSKGMFPSITLIELANGDGSKEEQKWIKFFRNYGIELTNGTDGGDGNSNPSLEVREKIRQSLCGTVPTVQARKNMSIGHKRYFQEHPEAIEKVRATHTGRKNTKETIEKMRASARLRGISKETRAKIKATIQAQMKTPEGKARVKKASLAAAAIPYTKERRITISVKSKKWHKEHGMVFTPTYKKHMRDAQKKRFQDPEQRQKLVEQLMIARSKRIKRRIG